MSYYYFSETTQTSFAFAEAIGKITSVGQMELRITIQNLIALRYETLQNLAELNEYIFSEMISSGYAAIACDPWTFFGPRFLEQRRDIIDTFLNGIATLSRFNASIIVGLFDHIIIRLGQRGISSLAGVVVFLRFIYGAVPTIPNTLSRMYNKLANLPNPQPDVQMSDINVVRELQDLQAISTSSNQGSIETLPRLLIASNPEEPRIDIVPVPSAEVNSTKSSRKNTKKSTKKNVEEAPKRRRGCPKKS